MEKEKLKENEKGNFERLEKHSKLIMPVLTPAYPQQSSAFNVNYSTMKIIKQTIIEGLKGIRQIRNLNEASHLNEILKQWIKGVNFVDKYNHFVTIICVGIDENIGEDFCNFVKNRIRVELILSMEEYSKLEYSHISPNKSKKGKCEKRLIAGKKFKKFWEDNWCKQWIVGLNMPELFNYSNKEKISLNYYFLKFIKKIKGKYIKHRKIERTNVAIHLRYTDIHEAKKFWGDN
uniref:polynucleotide adenylyltransferase n=1 Tax=Meloidogyne enterolobii TaxID=390850 RepID=A0A6V7UUV3_MELEN|nr:unnamed protein product [Meloidogyne enterolobii]